MITTSKTMVKRDLSKAENYQSYMCSVVGKRRVACPDFHETMTLQIPRGYDVDFCTVSATLCESSKES